MDNIVMNDQLNICTTSPSQFIYKKPIDELETLIPDIPNFLSAESMIKKNYDNKNRILFYANRLYDQCIEYLKVQIPFGLRIPFNIPFDIPFDIRDESINIISYKLHKAGYVTDFEWESVTTRERFGKGILENSKYQLNMIIKNPNHV
jgi:hypothetical protein